MTALRIGFGNNEPCKLPAERQGLFTREMTRLQHWEGQFPGGVGSMSEGEERWLKERGICVSTRFFLQTCFSFPGPDCTLFPF